VSCIRRLAGAGIVSDDVIALLDDAAADRPGPLDTALAGLAAATPDDPVDAALLRRDREALLDLLAAHRRVQIARSFTGDLDTGGHRVAVGSGLLVGDDLPPSTAAAPDVDDPLPADLLAEVLLVADVLERGNSETRPLGATVSARG
jgi:hypothetical protein